VSSSTAFEPVFRLPLISDVSIDTRPQKGLEARLGKVVISKIIFFECAAEESLRKVFGILIVGVPLDADVLVNGFPITVENRSKGSLTELRFVAAYTNDC